MVNFCVAILMLKMEYAAFTHMMFYFFKKGKNTTETHTEKICAVYGEGTLINQMCQKWFAKFHAGDFSLDDAPQLCRPVEVDRDQIETLIENNQRYTIWERADVLKISKSIKLLVKMKSVSFILWKNRVFSQPNIRILNYPIQKPVFNIQARNRVKIAIVLPIL